MQVIYDKKTGFIYATSNNSYDIEPAVLEVELKEGELLARVIAHEGKEPRAEIYKSSERLRLEELEKTLGEKIEEISARQQTTDIALAELTMNSMV